MRCNQSARAVERVNGPIVDRVLVIELNGPYGSLMADKLRALAEQLQVLENMPNLRTVVLDFSRVPWIGAGFVGTLVQARACLRQRGVGIEFCCLNDACRSVLRATRAGDLFSTFDSREAAIRSLGSVASEVLTGRSSPIRACRRSLAFGIAVYGAM